jgi:hypothetical protein
MLVINADTYSVLASVARGSASGAARWRVLYAPVGGDSYNTAMKTLPGTGFAIADRSTMHGAIADFAESVFNRRLP